MVVHRGAGRRRRGFTIHDLAVTVSLSLVAAGLLVSLTGANRDLSKTQVCANNLRQMFTGLTAYVNQYNSYPPNGPAPTYAQSVNITLPGGTQISSGGWDPSIGWILTYGLGIEPPARETPTGHFKWYGTAIDQLPGVCVCPSLPPEMLDLNNPELATYAYEGIVPMESVLYQYALSYQTSGTCRAATRVVRIKAGTQAGLGGRNPVIPDPSNGTYSGQMANNCQRVAPPYVYVFQKKPGSTPGDPGDPYTLTEYPCWIQAVHPAEVQSPGRTYYLADSRDYRMTPLGQPYSKNPAGTNIGWWNGWGNKVFLGTRHFEYANVLDLDGRVTRGSQTHEPRWNMEYDPYGNGQSDRWRAGTFATDVTLCGIRTQVHIMPVLCVKGWEYFFGIEGQRAK